MKTNKKWSRGFTLIEMLATVGILTILLGVGFVGTARAAKLLKVTELDNMAREIYMAANERAVRLSRSGQLETMVSSQTEKDVAGNPVPLIDKSADARPQLRYYIRYSPTEPGILDGLLPEGTVDPSLQNGCFYIVYEVYAGSVTDVFYAEFDKEKNNNMDKALLDTAYLGDPSGDFKKFYENWMNSAEEGWINRANRVNAKTYVGYYGGNPAEIPTKKEKLPAPKIEVINGEELVLKVTYEEAAGEIGRTLTTTLSYAEMTVTLPAGEKTYTGEGAVQLWILDSLKPSYGSSRRKFKDWGWNWPEVGGEEDTSLGGNFTVKATLAKDGWIPGEAASDRPYNSLFAEDSGGETARIANLRHLQNLSSGFSYAANKKNAIQINDIDAGKAVGYDGTVLDPSYEFTPIENGDLKYYEAMYENVRHTISNLKVTNTSAMWNWGAGLFGAVQYGQFRNIHLVDVNVDATEVQRRNEAGELYFVPVGGLIGSSGGNTFINCSVEGSTGRSSVHGKEAAGGLVGTTWGFHTFEGCSAKKIDVTSEKNYGGGLVGYLWGKSALKECEINDAGVIAEERYAGALVGLAGSMEKDDYVQLENCYVGRETKAVVWARIGAGGVAGLAQNAQFKNCEIARAEVYGRIGSSENGLSVAGGLAAEAKDTQFEGCRVGYYVENITGADGTVSFSEKDGEVSIAGGLHSGGLTGFLGKAADNDGALLNLQENKLTNCTAKNVAITGGVSWNDENYCSAGGLIGSAEEATFSNCNAERITLTNEGPTGGLVGNAINAAFQSCSVLEGTRITGKASRNWNTLPTDKALRAVKLGGLAGEASVYKPGGKQGDTFFTDCKVIEIEIKGVSNGSWDGEPAGELSTAGGLVGNATRIRFSSCRAENVKVTGGSSVGGLAGNAVGTIFESGTEALNCTLTGGEQVGGLAGNASAADVTNVKSQDGSAIIGKMDDAASDFSQCIVINTKITQSTDSAGGLVGGASEATFTDCTVSNRTTGPDNRTVITAKNNAGGLAGYVTDSTLTGCRANNITVGSDESGEESVAAGGLAGSAANSTFKDCAAGQEKTADSETPEKIRVNGKDNTGGLAGFAQSTSFTGCIAVNAAVTGILRSKTETRTTESGSAVTADLEIRGNAGGLAGSAVKAKWEGCRVYWTDPGSLGTSDALNYQITGTTAGGLVGAMVAGGTITNSFAATLVRAEGTETINSTATRIGTAGGLVGELQVEVTEKEDGSKVVDAVQRNVTVESSYADCYLSGNSAGGLIGANVPAKISDAASISTALTLQNVYAAGFIQGVGEKSSGAGLCGGATAPKKAANVYSAMHYESVSPSHPLMEAAAEAMDRCYFQDWVSSNWKDHNGNGVNDSDFRTALGIAFDTVTQTHRYMPSSSGSTAYPFPGLKIKTGENTYGNVMPHYGDWKQ